MGEAAPDIGERYRCAINSSNLRVEERIQGDSDMLMAAGWTSSLGTMLYRLAAEYDQVKGDILNTAPADQTGALLILMHLKTLNSTRDALRNFALEMATKRRFMLTDKVVGALAWRCLIAWLDPNCHRCAGRGFTGGYDGRMQTICRPCKGSGKVIQSIGETDVECAFVAQITSEMKRMFNVADGRLQKFLKRN